MILFVYACHDFLKRGKKYDELQQYVWWLSTTEEIADKFCNEILLLRIEGHLTTSVKGTIYDIWDCSNEIVTDFWVIKY